ncbi:ATP-binding cassette domain-containing protein [Streptomyces halobius]|uniref:ATP-binding cassette domain-containing protein n=1 Tax=Streptomyces halobius TaxID=2879846 RepID=UPI003872D307
MPTQISLRDVTKSYADQPLFDGVSLSIRPGDRIGIVGENGAGKSTLLRIIAGAEQPDEGHVVLRADGGIGYLGQTPDLPPDHMVQDAIDTALADLRDMERRLRTLEAGLDRASPQQLDEYGDLLTLFELRGGYEADARVDKALYGLGLDRVDHDRPLGTLSGGEQARLGLACLIAASPEVMLLDEPTNHLDAAALDWLEDALLTRRGTVLAVSHDRLFLQRVATAMIEVDADRRAVVRYGGGYRTLVAARAAARRRWEQDYDRWREQIAQLTDFAAVTAHSVACDGASAAAPAKYATAARSSPAPERKPRQPAPYAPPGSRPGAGPCRRGSSQRGMKAK